MELIVSPRSMQSESEILPDRFETPSSKLAPKKAVARVPTGPSSKGNSSQSGDVAKSSADSEDKSASEEKSPKKQRAGHARASSDDAPLSLQSLAERTAESGSKSYRNGKDEPLPLAVTKFAGMFDKWEQRKKDKARAALEKGSDEDSASSSSLSDLHHNVNETITSTTSAPSISVTRDSKAQIPISRSDPNIDTKKFGGKKCNKCGLLQDSGHFCMKCGGDLILVCLKCETIQTTKNPIFCIECGSRLS
jgi:hypothetical protein